LDVWELGKGMLKGPKFHLINSNTEQIYEIKGLDSGPVWVSKVQSPKRQR